jgi:hypothetical protein
MTYHYEATGVVRNAHGFVEIGSDSLGVVELRVERGDMRSRIRLRPEIAQQVSELLSQAALRPSAAAPSSEAKQSARRFAALQLMVARELVSAGRGMTEHEFTRAIASALAGELRKGMTISETGKRDEILQALEDDAKGEPHGNGLAD